MKIAIVVGAATPPGRLNQAAEHLAAVLLERQAGADVAIVNLATAGVEICDGRPLDKCSAATQETVATIAGANAVILASPVYRASFTGVLKNLLDQLPVESLQDKPLGIVAMGGSPHHYLGVDGHLRMVLAWFGAFVLPNSVYLTGKDFTEGKLASETAVADISALAETLLLLADRMAGRKLGPTPLAARYT